MEEKYKIHSFYILLILVSVIICLVSIEWSAVPELVNYITFALTLSSLILAILAIIYSIHSNSSISISLNDMSKSALEITRASSDICKSNDELRSEVLKFPDGLIDVGKHVAKTNSILEEIKEGGVNIAKTGTSLYVTENTELSNKAIQNFLSITSLSGLYVLLAVSLANKTNTAFTLSEIFKKIQETEVNSYSLGFFMCSSAIGLFSFKIDAQERYVINNVHEVIAKADIIEKFVTDKITELLDDLYKDDSEGYSCTEKEWLGELEMIKSYFGEPTTVKTEQ